MLERIKRCYHIDCEITSPLWSPTILGWAKGYTKKNSIPIRVEIGMCLCETHKEDFKLNDIEEIEEIINRTTTMYKTIPVNMQTLEIEFNPVLEFQE